MTTIKEHVQIIREGGGLGDEGLSLPMGQANTMSNEGASGIGVFDNKNGYNFEMRNIASASPDWVDVNLDPTDKTIELSAPQIDLATLNTRLTDGNVDDQSQGRPLRWNGNPPLTVDSDIEYDEYPLILVDTGAPGNHVTLDLFLESDLPNENRIHGYLFCNIGDGYLHLEIDGGTREFMNDANSYLINPKQAQHFGCMRLAGNPLGWFSISKRLARMHNGISAPQSGDQFIGAFKSVEFFNTRYNDALDAVYTLSNGETTVQDRHTIHADGIYNISYTVVVDSSMTGNDWSLEAQLMVKGTTLIEGSYAAINMRDNESGHISCTVKGVALATNSYFELQLSTGGLAIGEGTLVTAEITVETEV